jgi:imidazolonepropionase-like amidohydrolase
LAQVIDLQGKYVMPGLINLHVHLGATIGLDQNEKFFTPENVEKDLKTYASYGVTTVLSMGTDKDSIFKIRDEQRAGRPAETRIYTAGQGFVFKGGYGGLEGVNQGVATVAEVEPAVAAQAAKHALRHRSSNYRKRAPASSARGRAHLLPAGCQTAG